MALTGRGAPQVGIPWIMADLTGAPVLPAPQAMSGNVVSRVVAETEASLVESRGVNSLSDVPSVPAKKINSTTTSAQAVSSTNTSSVAANNANGGAAVSNAAANSGPSLKTAGGRTITNSKWAGQSNPLALNSGYTVPVKSNGYPDFSKYLFVKAPHAAGSTQVYNTVNISMTGTYGGDFAAANKLAGFS